MIPTEQQILDLKQIPIPIALDAALNFACGINERAQHLRFLSSMLIKVVEELELLSNQENSLGTPKQKRT